MKNIIYRISNTINGKVYIGQTTQGLSRRRGEHIHRLNRGERNHKLYQAMRKYGIDSFKFEVLCVALCKEYLDELEQYFIAEYNSFYRGYNMTIGGDTISEETRQKLSKAFKGRKITWYNKILDSRASNPQDASIKTHFLLNSVGMIMEVTNLAKFCKDNKLDVSNLYSQSKKDKFSKGYLLLEGSTTRRKP